MTGSARKVLSGEILVKSSSFVHEYPQVPIYFRSVPQTGVKSKDINIYRMVAEPWINKMKNHVSTNLKHTFSLDNPSSTAATATAKKKDPKPPPAPDTCPKSHTIGILSFEVANAMSKAAHLHKSLSDSQISYLRSDILKSQGIRTVVSTDEFYLLELVLAEKLDELNRVAALVSRLGKKCSEQALMGFEHVYADLLSGRINVGKLGFLVKDMERTVKKMERFVNSTSSLYGELGVLTELEQGVKKFQLAQHHEETRRAVEQKISWHRHDVRNLRNTSLWNQTYDKIVGLMAKAVCTIYARICLVFGDFIIAPEGSLDKSRNLSDQIVSDHHRLAVSGLLRLDTSESRSGRIQQRRPVMNLREETLGFPCGSSPGRLFLDCLSLSSSSSWKDIDDYFDRESHTDTVGISTPFSGDQRQHKGSKRSGSFFGPKSKVTTHAAPSTIGGSALALHYANIVIIIEKLLQYPHLVGEEARDDLYQMLPASLKMSLKRSLKSYIKNMAIYDAPLAHDWKQTLDNILSWLAPMAHNMIRWQTERNFEQQQIVLRTNVLLLQTLYFADREKTEAAICELLVGLNYICRYEHQQNALLDCRSSADFGDCPDWQLQY